jgi:gamma-glutamyltranspeptidase/glutathione hydrolase
MIRKYTRREMLIRTGAVLAVGLYAPGCVTTRAPRRRGTGAIAGELTSIVEGKKVLAAGGNAIDAVVTAALTSCAATPSRCGIGGYGGHMTIAMASSRKIVSIDFNSTAPAAARPDMFPVDANGVARTKSNVHGWLAAGVPGTLAGLQLALDCYGTRSFSEAVQPAIAICKNGFVVKPEFARALNGAAAQFRKDPGSVKLYLKNGLMEAGDTFTNPQLADLLSTLARRNSVKSFYRGDIAQQIADAFQKNGGLVTAKDMAAYHAREVKPLQMDWGGFSIFTAPLTAGGLTVLQAIAILKVVHWESIEDENASLHARLEALRLAWKDRLELLGDPEKSQIPTRRLLSQQYAGVLAEKVTAAVREKRPVPLDVKRHFADGTNNFSCADADGNLVALTLTHGGGFGAQVTVDGLGLTLGHGMSRFDPNPGHSNAPGPGKRPLHNMCPTVVLREGQPIFAVGGAGGIRIPNGIYDVLSHYVGKRQSLEQSVAAPRMNSSGTLEVVMEKTWPAESTDYLRNLGYTIKAGDGATMSAVYCDPVSGESRGAMR